MKLLSSVLALSLPLALLGQEPNPTQTTPQPPSNQAAASQPGGPNPIFRVQVVSRSVQAVSYRNRSGWTKVDFQGTSLAPQAKGTAEVISRLGHMQLKIETKKLPAASQFGPLFLTYVLWAVTPDGHASNLGEVVVNSDGNFKAESISTELQFFGLIVTAEPYFAVHQPSDVVVMENVVRTDTKGKVEAVDAKYELMKRGQYTYHVPESEQRPVLTGDKKSPIEIYEAVNAVQIAKYAKADQFGGDTYQNAVQALAKAQEYRERKQWGPSIMTAKEAVQRAEESRIVSLRKQQQMALEQERADAAARQEAAHQRTLAAQQQASEEERQRKVAEEQAAREAAARAEADVARAQASASAEKAKMAAEEADRLRMQAEKDKDQLRAQLLQQFNSVLPTRETTRGLVVNMQDVLFDTAKYSLKDPAQLALARISGIIVSHPGLNLQIEGYTDSTGGDDFNQKLSEQRSNSVRDFLMRQGLNTQTMTAVGYGKNYPVSPNDTAAGRKQNRRVELVVSGEVIGVKIGTPPVQTPGVPVPAPAPTAAVAPSAPPR